MVLVVKNSPAKAGDIRGSGSIPWAGKMPQRRKWQSTPVSLPGISQGRRSLACYSPQDLKKLGIAEVT